MRIHELVPTREAGDLVIHNPKTGHTLTLTPEGAVYQTPDTRDIRNMAIAFGVLFTSDEWRAATTEEITEFINTPEQFMLTLNWALPKKPQLRLITKEEE